MRARQGGYIRKQPPGKKSVQIFLSKWVTMYNINKKRVGGVARGSDSESRFQTVQVKGGGREEKGRCKTEQKETKEEPRNEPSLAWGTS